MTKTPLYPLKFSPIYKEKVWGGRTLEGLGRTLPSPEAMVGESWELVDLATTSASGGGGARPGPLRTSTAPRPAAGARTKR